MYSTLVSSSFSDSRVCKPHSALVHEDRALPPKWTLTRPHADALVDRFSEQNEWMDEATCNAVREALLALHHHQFMGPRPSLRARPSFRTLPRTLTDIGKKISSSAIFGQAAGRTDKGITLYCVLIQRFHNSISQHENAFRAAFMFVRCYEQRLRARASHIALNSTQLDSVRILQQRAMLAMK